MKTAQLAEYDGGTSISTSPVITFDGPAPLLNSSMCSNLTPESAWNIAGWGTDSMPAWAALLIGWLGLDDIIASATSDAINDVLKGLNITSFPQCKRDPAIEERLNEIVQSISVVKPPHLDIITGSIMSTTVYSHIKNVETKVFIAVYTMILRALDYPDVFESLATQKFHREICCGSIQHRDDMLGQLAKLVSTSWDHFLHFGANAVLSSTLDYLNACFLENISDATTISASTERIPFIEYRRVYGTGAAATYAVFIWDKDQFPDEKVFLQAMPDIILCLSYAKETWKECFKNYIGFHASTPKDRLQEVIDVQYMLEDVV
ncbi:hypothetical protein CERSUDRAFT_94613 [Gelatoporia subvermispora B]|uniref:Uncharacterized protein n=1 Tax=Ceriporiopsis subvermispora (strain B) TaxID=914234 RepID=M2RFL9_CERS8|nr:hypothetical protein CERSUDRAFT_94613 [Gelatoporia subvermispora B]